MQDAAEAFLTLINRRARTAEIVEYLHTIGVVESTDEHMVRTVSSYLSSARGRFDNQKGEGGGYGLVSWVSGDMAAPPSSPDETLDLPMPMKRMILPEFLRASPQRTTADADEESAA